MVPWLSVTSTDSENYDQAFENVIQKYRYLSHRSKISPIYLNRNLNYMKNRSKRTNKARKSFKVNSLLGRTKNACPMPECVTLMFFGYFDETLTDIDAVEVDTFLIRTSLEQDDKSSKPQIDFVARSMLRVNPNYDAQFLRNITAVNVSTLNFNPLTTSYKLMLTARVASKSLTAPYKINNNEPHGNIVVEYCLDFFDEQNLCQLIEGDYEIAPQSVKSKPKSFKKHQKWECEEIVLLDERSFCGPRKPLLKFRVCWTKEGSLGHQFMGTIQNERNKTIPTVESEGNMKRCFHNVAKETVIISELEYNFYYKRKRHVTKLRDIYECPVCHLDCLVLYSLLKHMEMCHDRLSFTCVPSGGARLLITVLLNELHKIDEPSCWPFPLTKSIRRTVFTRLLVHRLRREKPSLTEFFDVNELGGMNRIFYHSTTLQPVRPDDLDVDSEDEMLSPWLQKRNEMLIDSLTDVNEGEKEIIKMWNHHVLRKRFVGQIRLKLTCETFVDEMGIEILRKNLFKNFVLHTCHLVDLNEITSESQLEIISRLQCMMENDEESKKVLSRAREQNKLYLKTNRCKENQQKIPQENAYDVKLASRSSKIDKNGNTLQENEAADPMFIAESSGKSPKHKLNSSIDVLYTMVETKSKRRKSIRSRNPKNL